MKILSVFGGIIRTGGDNKSALACMKYLVKMGHEIHVMAPLEGSLKEMVQEFVDIGVELHDCRVGLKRGRFPDCEGATEIIKLCRDRNIEVIHALNFSSLAASYKASIKVQNSIVFTQAGGPLKNTIPPQNVDTIFFSQELLDGMSEKLRHSCDNVEVIPGRIDMDVYKPTEVNMDFIRQHALPETGHKIVMAIRLDEPKRPWLNSVLTYAEQLVGTDSDVHIIIAGQGSLFSCLKDKALQIEKANGRPIVHLIGPLFTFRDLNQLYNYADIVVGNGRGILEPMACGKAVVNLGENGEGALVSSENIENIAYYNYSGRHFRYQKNSDNDLASFLNSLITDTSKMAEAGRFSLEYIKNYMSSQTGAARIAEVYKKALQRKHKWFDYLMWYMKVIKFVLADGLQRRKSIIFPGKSN